MTFVPIDMPAFVGDLKHQVADVIFVKKDGSHRRMHCTLRPDMVPVFNEDQIKRFNESEARQESDAEPSLLVVWDVNANDWRTINTKTILFCQITYGY